MYVNALQDIAKTWIKMTHKSPQTLNWLPPPPGQKWICDFDICLMYDWGLILLL